MKKEFKITVGGATYASKTYSLRGLSTIIDDMSKNPIVDLRVERVIWAKRSTNLDTPYVINFDNVNQMNTCDATNEYRVPTSVLIGNENFYECALSNASYITVDTNWLKQRQLVTRVVGLDNASPAWGTNTECWIVISVLYD
jgi:hypothetical protein